jgi:hypothetical protein
MFSRQFLTSINKDIASISHFNENDFVIVSETSRGEENQEYRLEIAYRFNPEYKLTATVTLDEGPIEYHKDMRVITCPGSTYNLEVDRVSSEELATCIRTWLKRIETELLEAPYKRDLRDQQEQINKIVEQFQDLPNGYFTREEGDALRQKLADLEERLVENLTVSIEDQFELMQKTQVITKDMETLKNNITALDKRGWTTSLLVRSLGWLKDPVNRKVLTSGAQVAKDLLLEAGKDILDSK